MKSIKVSSGNCLKFSYLFNKISSLCSIYFFKTIKFPINRFSLFFCEINLWSLFDIDVHFLFWFGSFAQSGLIGLNNCMSGNGVFIICKFIIFIDFIMELYNSCSFFCDLDMIDCTCIIDLKIRISISLCSAVLTLDSHFIYY